MSPGGTRKKKYTILEKEQNWRKEKEQPMYSFKS